MQAEALGSDSAGEWAGEAGGLDHKVQALCATIQAMIEHFQFDPLPEVEQRWSSGGNSNVHVPADARRKWTRASCRCGLGVGGAVHVTFAWNIGNQRIHCSCGLANSGVEAGSGSRSCEIREGNVSVVVASLKANASM